MPEENTATNLLAVLDSNPEDAMYRFRLMPGGEQVDLVRSAPADRRWDVITLAEDAAPLVRALSVPELYAVANAEDIDGRLGTLMAVTTPEQARGVMDFACWTGDEPAEEDAFPWFRWLMELPDADAADRLRVLDPSFIAAAIGPHVTRAKNAGPGEFVVVATRVDALPTGLDFDDDLVEWIVQRIFDVDHELFDEVVNRIFRDEWTGHAATHAGLADQLAEAAHIRAQRLRALELGDTYEARAELLQPLELHLPRSTRPISSLLPARVPRVPMLDAVSQITEDPHRGAEWSTALARLVGDVVMARGGNPSSRGDVERATEYTRSAVNLALDALSGGSPWFAVSLVEQWSLRDLFRAGNTLVERLRWRVSTIVEDDIEDERDRVQLVGLFRTPMRVYDAGIDDYRLPQFVVELTRAHRIIHAIQIARFEAP